MTQAPTPGHEGRKRAKRQGFRVTLYGQVYELQMRDLGPGDAGLVRQTTGRPLATYLNDIDIDSFAVIVWMARRKSGEKKLTLAKVFESFPTWGEFSDLIDEGLADFEILEDVDEVEDDAVNGAGVADPHPLPSAER